MTNKLLGLPIFLLIIYLTFLFTFTCAEPFMGFIENFFAWLGHVICKFWSADSLPWLRSLVVEGIISGVGGVLVFLPNIVLLFFAIAILEDSGYMSRAAFVMDGIMRQFGLQGRSFVPLVLGFGCNVPAIMATRCIESQRDRTVTIMVLPLMSCGARLPIYALFIPAFFPQMASFMMWLMYLIGVVIALVAAVIMKNTLFKGDGEVYLMELPPYRMPSFRSLMLHVWERSKEYLHKAGTIILLTSIILFICNTWPEKKVFSEQCNAEVEASLEQYGMTPEQLQNMRLAEKMEYTISGRVGHALEPFFKPLGFDWRVVTASIGAVAAKEIFVSQLGILFAAGDGNEAVASLRNSLRQNYSKLQAFCIMLFCLLSVPCLATLAVIRRELNSWKIMLLEAAGLFALAWMLTAIVYQIGTLV